MFARTRRTHRAAVSIPAQALTAIGEYCSFLKLTTRSSQDAVNEEKFAAVPAQGFEPKTGRLADEIHPATVGHGRSITATEHQRGNRLVHLIHNTGPKEAFIELASAFAEQAFDVIFLAQPLQGGLEVELLLSEDPDFVRDFGEPRNSFRRCGAADQNNNGREPVLKNGRIRVECAGSTDDDAQVVFGEAAFASPDSVLPRAGAEVNRGQIDRPRPSHHRIGGRAQLQQEALIARTAEGDEFACNRRQFPVHGCGNID